MAVPGYDVPSFAGINRRDQGLETRDQGLEKLFQSQVCSLESLVAGRPVTCNQ